MNSDQRAPLCPCQNNGYCDISGNCVCPQGYRGTYCGLREQQRCPDPGIPAGGERMTEDGGPAFLPRPFFREGDSLVYSCATRDTALQGVSIIRCREDGTWSAPAPQCVRDPSITCSSPAFVSNANRVNTDESPSTMDQVYTPGQSVVYSCVEGYSLRGNSMITCRRNGQWSGTEPRCTPIRMYPGIPPEERSCRQPESDPNGFIEDDPLMNPNRRRRYPPGSKLTFGCLDGYRTVGALMLYCLNTGEWSSMPPICQQSRQEDPGDQQNCPNRPFPEGSEVIVSGNPDDSLTSGSYGPYNSIPGDDNSAFPPGTHLHYTCKEDRPLLIGSNNLVCSPSGYWHPDPPICVEDCGRVHVQTNHMITNGSSTEAGDWPWQVFISTNNGGQRRTCGGALIDNRTVLTAAHCAYGFSSLTLYFGKYNNSISKDDDQVEMRVTKQIIVHEDFDNVTYENDIAILSFEPSVAYTRRIQPVCLPTPPGKNFIGKKGAVTGWGMNENNLMSKALMVAHLPVQPDDECMDSYAEHGLTRAIHEGMFCAGYTEGVVSACRGDSGSPLVFMNSSTLRQTMEGLVSFGHSTKSCGSPRVYTVFTKVAYYMPWIREKWDSLGEGESWS